MEWRKSIGMHIFSALVPLLIMAMAVDWIGGVPGKSPYIIIVANIFSLM